MNEIVFLNFGNYSNFVNTHFWNLNDELFKTENKFNLDQSKIYTGPNENIPMTLIFDYSNNIYPYRVKNTKITSQVDTEDPNIVSYVPKDFNPNNFLKMINDEFPSEEEVKKKMIIDEENNEGMEEEEEKVITKKDVYSMDDDNLLYFLDFENSVKNWNDYCQPLFSERSLNELKIIDLEQNSQDNYLKGSEFYSNSNFQYVDLFENNFRYFLEKCDLIGTINVNVEYNSFWGGLSTKFLQYVSSECPKVNQIHHGYENFNPDFVNIDTLINSLFYYSDQVIEKNTILFQNSFIDLHNNEIKPLFGLKNNNENKQGYNYFVSSIFGLNTHNLYQPYRSTEQQSNSYLKNLYNNNLINFFETDIILPLESTNYKSGKKNSGEILNFNRNPFYVKNYKIENYLKNEKIKNVSVITGYSDKLFILDDKIENYLMKYSTFAYTNTEKFMIPICFPRKYFVDNKEYNSEKLSVFNNFRQNLEGFDIFSEIIFQLKYKKNDVKKRLVKSMNNIQSDEIEEVENRIENIEYMNELGKNLKDYYGISQKKKNDLF